MTYVIAAPCVHHNDQSCLDVCPVDCIDADTDATWFQDPAQARRAVNELHPT